MVDSRTKWIEAILLSTTTVSKTIEVLRELFASYGLPEEVVSDDGPQFTSEELKLFLQNNGIKQSLTPPYHPSSDGAAEHTVQIVKSALKKHFIESRTCQQTMPVKQMLANFLLAYRATPHTVTGESPAIFFLGRKLRTWLDFLRPDLDKKVRQKQEKEKETHDNVRQDNTISEFQVNEPCLTRNYCGGREVKWIKGRVIKRLSSLCYRVQIGGTSRVTHRDQIEGYRGIQENSSHRSSSVDLTDDQLRDLVRLPEVAKEDRVSSVPVSADSTHAGATPVTSPQPKKYTSNNSEMRSAQNTSWETCVGRRYPPRLRKPVQRLDL